MNHSLIPRVSPFIQRWLAGLVALAATSVATFYSFEHSISTGETSTMSNKKIPAGYNRLYLEKSPYLKQHAKNPVEWYPWGGEAFEAARKLDRPVLVSIGYSTCHWCHVMEKESFSNPETAGLMNENFINIKVDREERPDVDKIYMAAVQAMTGSGGWPLNAFLTPDRKPFWGGTYFPPTGAFNRPSWSEVITQLGAAWKDKTKRIQILESGDKLIEAVEKMNAVRGKAVAQLDATWIDAAVESFEKSFDSQLGGFSPAPKFPMPVNLVFLLRAQASFRNTGRTDRAENILSMLTFTLTQMHRGGIYDHVGGGFARYSTDEYWHIPHFEKMLYDNAQLVPVYLDAWRVSGEDEYLEAAEETLEYIRRDMTGPEGAFYSAEDADSLPPELAAKHGKDESHEHKEEGAFYVWEQGELETALGPDALRFNEMFGVKIGGNARSDPRGEFTDKNILYASLSMDEAAKKWRISIDEARGLRDRSRKILLQRRAARPRPHLDNKYLSGWNGLMISAFANACQATGKEEFALVADKAARFIKDKMYDQDEKRLYRRFSEGERLIHGNADDYAYVCAAALDLYEATFDPAWLAWAIDLADATQKNFFDPQDGAYFMTGENHDENLVLRLKDTSDNVEPAAASVAVMNNLRLWLLADRPDLRDAAEKTLKCFGETMRDQGRALPAMLGALDFAMNKPSHVIIVGRRGSADVKAMTRAVRQRYRPNQVMALIDSDNEASRQGLPFAENFKMIDGKAAVYICIDFACSLPTADPAEAAALLEKKAKNK